MADMKVRVDVDLGGNLPANAPRWNAAFNRMAQGVRGAAPILSAAATHASAGLDRLGNRYVALATGAGGVGALRYLGNMDERLRGLAVQANVAPERIDALKDKIYEVANAPEIRVNPAGILDAVDKIVEKTGNLDLAEENLRNIGLTMRAANAEGRDVGAMVADLNEKFGVDGPDVMNRSLDTLVNQGKAGSFTLQNLASQGERVTAAYGRLGRTGPGAVREMGAALQMIRKGVGSPEMAATALEAVVRTLVDAEKSKLIQGAGIELVDPENINQMRSLPAIMQDILTHVDKNTKNAVEFEAMLGKIFDSEAARALTQTAQELRATGGFGSFQKFMEVDDSGAALLKDAEFRAKGFNAALRSLTTSAERYADKNLAGPVQDLAGAIDRLDPETVNATMDAIGKGALAVGGLILLNKAIRGVMWGMRGIGALRRGAGAGGAAAAAAASPVFITNWPMGAGGVALGGGRYTKAGRRVPSHAGAATTAAAAGGTGVLSRAVGFGRGAIGRAGVPLLALMSAPEMIEAMFRGDGETAWGVGGRVAGAAGGAALGAALGSVVPVLGNLVGGLAGAALGAYAGEEGVRTAYRLLVGVDPDSGKLTLRKDRDDDGAMLIDAGALSP